MSGSLDVRRAGPEDWAVWRDLRLRSLRDSPDAFGSTYDREAEYPESLWRERLAEGPGFLGLLDDEPVGLGAGWLVSPGELRVVSMWVEPARRGHGVGRAVLDALVDWAATRGLRTHLDVSQANPRARALYERAGFVPTGLVEPLRPGATLLTERMDLVR